MLRRGDRGPRVAAVREQLAAVGLDCATAPGEDPGLFDARLERAVRGFQQQRGLTSDGVVGAETSRALDAARWRLGDRILRYTPGHLVHGDDVTALQERLSSLGLLDDRVDGVLGPATERALRELQRGLGLTPDGTCGPATLRALQRLQRTVRGGDVGALRDTERVRRSGSSLVGRVVVVDPGHGGDDPGAVGNGLREADVVLDLALRLEGRLAASGVTAVLTRGAGQNPSTRDRARLADDVRADLFVSLHCDAATGTAGQGVATSYWGDPRVGTRSPVGARLADLVQRELVARTDLVDCRTHARTWDLLRLTRMPAVRVELGYLTDPGDARRLADPAFRDTCAEALLVAVQRLFLPEDEDPATGTLRVDDVLARVRAADGPA
ncbi:N-acetylmuramoyl-L-alanine amidase [Kineosporiaceae bacterium SCSIO 59966]|nr:N-acetylmuramoyl-L-alanine amidase [Kineosporiaceae bacterium SCSIO 59966]